MRIAQVVPAGAHPYAGVLRAIVELSVHLAGIGHDVEAWLLAPWSQTAAAVHGGALAEAGVHLVAPPESGGSRAALGERDADIVHLHSVFTPPNALLARRLRAPFVVSPHGGYAPVSLTRGPIRKKLYTRLVERRLLRGAALRVALTEAEAEDLRAFGATEPIAVIPNGVAPAPPEVDGDAFRRELDLDPSCPLLLFVGRLDIFHKGLDVLVDAVAAVPAWHLALVGPDVRGGAQWLQRHAGTLHAQRRLTLAGPRQGRALHEAYAAADLFALTSRWEGLPLSLLEALSHGTPALVTPAVERSVGVAGAGAGWTAAPGELAAALERLRRLGPEEWAGHADRARALAGRYTWTEVARQYDTAYRGVLARAPR